MRKMNVNLCLGLKFMNIFRIDTIYVRDDYSKFFMKERQMNPLRMNFFFVVFFFWKFEDGKYCKEGTQCY